nr:uncharacterized protein LOC110141643 isoform X1 [Odocoileus virginianus texanus]
MAGGRPAAPPVSLKHRGAVVCYIPEGRLMTAGLLSHETLVSSLITAGSGRHPRKTSHWHPSYFRTPASRRQHGFLSVHPSPPQPQATDCFWVKRTTARCRGSALSTGIGNEKEQVRRPESALQTHSQMDPSTDLGNIHNRSSAGTHPASENKVFSQETLKKNSQAPNASRPDSRPLPKQKHSLDASFLQWQNSSKDLFYGSCSVRT